MTTPRKAGSVARKRRAALPRKQARPRSSPAWSDRVQSSESQRAIKEAVLYETAARWFNRHGFHGTSLGDIANEIGITKAALYYYVRDKSDLLYKLHLRAAEAAKRAHDRAVNEGGNGLERVQRIVTNYVAASTSSPTETFILLEDGALSAAQSAEIIKRRKWLDNDLRRQIETGIADGSITPCDSKLAVLAIVGALAWASKWYNREGFWSSDQVAIAMGQMLARMLSSGPALELPTDVGAIVAAAPPSDAEPAKSDVAATRGVISRRDKGSSHLL
jgi:TetR/AcrR family transcriptional regulator